MSDKTSKCAVLGAGTMGAQIALSLALGGANVMLWGRRSGSLQPALERCVDAFDFLAKNDLVDPANKVNTISRITLSDKLEDVADCDIIIEAVAEDLSIKQNLLKTAETFARSNAILSSTTSALSATEIQSTLSRPEKFCVAHYAQPAHLVELVEVVPGEQSSEHATEVITELLVKTGKTPVLCPDIPGFLWARIQHAVLREFATLVGKGLVTPEACDTILKVGYASRLPAMGSFEHADLAGLDLINSPAAKAVWADLSNVSDPKETPVGELLNDGKLGMKSGSGFYDWTVRNPDEFKQKRDEEIIRRVKINRGGEITLKS